jgi:hypothetical protein
LVDLYFASEADRAKLDCEQCRKKRPQERVRRRCDEDGFENGTAQVKGAKDKTWQVDKAGAKFGFCPGKAKWYPEMAQLFNECKAAHLTGYLPEPGRFWDQHELFCEVYHIFVERYHDRHYARVWRDIHTFAPEVIKAFGEIVLAPWKK